MSGGCQFASRRFSYFSRSSSSSSSRQQQQQQQDEEEQSSGQSDYQTVRRQLLKDFPPETLNVQDLKSILQCTSSSLMLFQGGEKLAWNSSLYNRACAGAASSFLNDKVSMDEASELYRSFVQGSDPALLERRSHYREQMRQLNSLVNHRILVGTKDERWKKLLDSIIPNRIRFQYAINEAYMSKKRRRRKRGVCQ